MVFGSRGALSFTDDPIDGGFQSALIFEEHVIQHAQWPYLKNIKKYFVIVIFNIYESSDEDYYDY